MEQTQPAETPRGGIMPPLSSERPTYYRYGVMAFLCSLSFLTYFDRVCIVRATKEIRTDLGISGQEFGWIMGSFWLAYGLFEIPGGWLGDRYGPRRGLMRVVIGWSFFTALSGCAAGFFSLLACRFLFGMGEAGAYPNMGNIQSRWLPEQTRARAGGLLWLCARWGGAFSPVIFGNMVRAMDSKGFRDVAASIPGLSIMQTIPAWRLGFFASGLIGVVWCAAFYFWFKDNPSDKKGVNQAEIDLIQSGRKESAHSHHSGDWKALFTSPNLWAMAALYFFASFPWSFYVSWMPTYLDETFKVDFRNSEWMTVWPLFAGGLSCLIGGSICDFVVKRTGWRWFGRAIFPITGYVVAAIAMFGIRSAKSADEAAQLLVLAAAAHDFGQGANWATIVDIGGLRVGLAAGFVNMIGNITNFVQPPVGNYIKEHSGWSTLFTAYAAMYVVAVVLWFFIDPRKTFYEGREAQKPAVEPALVPAGERGGVA